MHIFIQFISPLMTGLCAYLYRRSARCDVHHNCVWQRCTAGPPAQPRAAARLQLWRQVICHFEQDAAWRLKNFLKFFEGLAC